MTYSGCGTEEMIGLVGIKLDGSCGWCDIEVIFVGGGSLHKLDANDTVVNDNNQFHKQTA
jgi:hypothetical protein